jgi:hypothetical protein
VALLEFFYTKCFLHVAHCRKRSVGWYELLLLLRSHLGCLRTTFGLFKLLMFDHRHAIYRESDFSFVNKFLHESFDSGFRVVRIVATLLVILLILLFHQQCFLNFLHF